MPASDEIFVGRNREVAELTAALEEALSGRGRLTMVAGEPGIGKTRLAEELSAAARRRGAEVLWGSCPEERGAPPYWPWVQAISAHVEATSTRTLQTELGTEAAVVADIVPAIAKKLSGLGGAPRIDEPESARFRLFSCIASLITGAAQVRPLVIVLDDLHWADGSSLRLLEFVAREIAPARIFLLGMYRDVEVTSGHPLSRTLGELTRQRLFGRVLLRGIEEGSTAELMKAHGGVAPAAALVSIVQRHTEGNPLFVRETVRLLASDGMLTAERMADPKPWRYKLPEGVREAIGRRLARLSRECQDLLAVAAVIGRDFPFAVLTRLRSGPTEQVLELLDEALSARIIAEQIEQPGQYEFTHALIQRTLAETLSLTRRVRLHAEIAQALEAMYGPRSDEHASELAYHYAEAVTLSGPDKALRYLLLAGERALAAYAYEEAVQHFKHAVDAKGEGPPDMQRAEMLSGLGRAQAGSLERTDMKAAVDSLTQAVDCYLAIGEPQRAVAVSAIPLLAIPGSTDVASLIERVLTYLDDKSAATPILLARYGEALGIERNDLDGATTFLERAMQVAESLGNREAVMHVAAYRTAIAGHHAMYDGLLERAVEVRKLAHELGNVDVELNMATMGLIAQVTSGDADGMRDTMEVVRELAPKLHHAQDIEQSCQLLNWCHPLFGEWEQARSLVDQGLSAAAEAPRQLGIRVFVEYATGNAEEGSRWAERLVARMKAAPATANWAYIMAGMILPAVVCMGADAGLLGPARTAVEVVLSDRATPTLRRHYAWRGLGMIAVQLADPDLAGRVYQPLLRAGFPTPVTNRRVLGLVAKTMGRPDLACTHFEDNLHFCRKADFTPELAWTCHDYAAMLLPNAGTLHAAERAKVETLLDEGEPIAQKLGMKPLALRFTALREKSAFHRDGRPGYPGGLTERQAEVLRLIAEGKTSREIAAELVLSLRTVQRHVADVYAKIEVRNRAEATAYALRELGPHATTPH